MGIGMGKRERKRGNRGKREGIRGKREEKTTKKTNLKTISEILKKNIGGTLKLTFLGH